MKMNRHARNLQTGALLALVGLRLLPTALAQDYTFTTLAGLPEAGAGQYDGTSNAVRFYYPLSVAMDGSSNGYVADSYNHTIRKITPAGVVSTLAGLAGSSGTNDGTGSAARFNTPYGVAVDSGGNVYVADDYNHTVRKITPAGEVTTLAGQAGSSGTNDGTGTAANFSYPQGVAVDSGGNLYVADTYNHTIRQITPVGEVTTLAGQAGSSGTNPLPRHETQHSRRTWPICT